MTDEVKNKYLQDKSVSKNKQSIRKHSNNHRFLTNFQSPTSVVEHI
jgi:hypothetical protein